MATVGFKGLSTQIEKTMYSFNSKMLLQQKVYPFIHSFHFISNQTMC